jgi:hypothetical protein
MLPRIYKSGFLLGVTAPQKKNYSFGLLIYQLNGLIREDFPALPLMRASPRLLNGQGRIEQ